MHSTGDELMAQAAKLSLDDRKLVLVRLQLAFEETIDPDIEAAWIAEAERRVEALDRGEMRSIP